MPTKPAPAPTPAPMPGKVGNPNFAPHPRRAEGEELLRSGKSVADVAKAIGANHKTVAGWNEKIHPRTNERPRKGPKKVTIPEMERPASGKGKPRATIFGKAKAGNVIGGMFSLVALRLGPGWKLTTEEKDMLGESLADCAHLAPSPVVGAVSKFAAPLTFITQLGSVVQSRLEAAYAEAQAIARQAAANARVNVAPPPPPDGSGFRMGPGDAPAAPPNGRMRDRNLG